MAPKTEQDNTINTIIQELQSGLIGVKPRETLGDFRKRTQSEVEAGTYVPPTGERFGAGIADKAIDIGRRLVGGVLGSPVVDTVGAVSAPVVSEQRTPPGALGNIYPEKTVPVGTVVQPAAPKPWYTQTGFGVSGQKGITPLGEQPTAVRTKIEHGRTTLEAQGINELAKTPEQITTERLKIAGVGSETELQIDKIRNDPGSYEGGVFAGRGLKKEALKAITDLQTNATTAQAATIGHGVEAKKAEEMRKSREMIADETAQNRKATLSQKKSEALWRRIELQAPVVGIDEKGEPIKARNVALLDLLDSGVKLPNPEDSPDLYPAAQKLWDDRELWITSQFGKLKAKYDKADINKRDSETYKHRMALLKIYRDELLKAQTPK